MTMPPGDHAHEHENQFGFRTLRKMTVSEKEIQKVRARMSKLSFRIFLLDRSAIAAFSLGIKLVGCRLACRANAATLHRSGKF